MDFLSALGAWDFAGDTLALGLLTYPEIDPIAVRLGPLALRWYALAYLVGALVAWTVMRRVSYLAAVGELDGVVAEDVRRRDRRPRNAPSWTHVAAEAEERAATEAARHAPPPDHEALAREEEMRARAREHRRRKARAKRAAGRGVKRRRRRRAAAEQRRRVEQQMRRDLRSGTTTTAEAARAAAADIGGRTQVASMQTGAGARAGGAQAGAGGRTQASGHGGAQAGAGGAGGKAASGKAAARARRRYVPEDDPPPPFWTFAPPAAVDEFISWAILSGLVGGRLGYVALYNFSYYAENPLQILFLWEGGMSFHGGLAGIVAAAFVYARFRRVPVLALTDLLAIGCPIGLLLGRMANFINGELYGRTSDLPWAMVFPDGGVRARHPSQLYEAALEGVVLFAFMLILVRLGGLFRHGLLTGWCFIGYGTVRFLVEFTREPDSHLGFLWLGLSLGQWLSAPMLVIGWIILTAHTRRIEPITLPDLPDTADARG